MKIAYVKTRKDKDPILGMIKELLPADKVFCADISSVQESYFSRIKMRRILQKEHPGLMIGYGDVAEILGRADPGIPVILIDPIGDIEDMDDNNLHIVHTGTTSDLLDTDTLSKCLIPVLDPLRGDVHANEMLLEELIEMALIKTESSPEDFDGTDDITDNLRRHRETAELSGIKCPDCGHHMIRFFVSSPAWTWQNLCGRAGILTYCPNCKSQHGFLLQMMN